MPERPTIISVIGGRHPSPADRDLAEEVGREIAERGAIVACGGLMGVMEAVCKGAKDAGGQTIGILPGGDPDDANPYVDIAICTGVMYARNLIVVKTGQAVIAIDGSYGTLSEIGHALADDIPVIGLNTWRMTSDNGEPDDIIRAATAEEAVTLALEAAAARKRRSARPQTRS